MRWTKLWKRSKEGPSRKAAASARNPRRPSLRVELLEPRLAPAVAATWVNDTWLEVSNGGGTPGVVDDGDTVMSDTSAGDAPVTGKIFGTNAFSSLQMAINATEPGGTVNILAGAYTLSENLTINKALSLIGPNQAFSPFLELRVSEATINGGAAGVYTGNSGFAIELGDACNSLTVEGLRFTRFDGSLFESASSPLTSVNLLRNIFDDNNGSLFFKFNTAVTTDFEVVDNLINNQSMVPYNPGASQFGSALFFLGNVANSQFDANKAVNVAHRELFNFFDDLTDTTLNDNVLENTAGLCGLFADQTGVQIHGNTIKNTIPSFNLSAIYIGTFNGRTISDLEISDNQIETVISGSGITLICNTQATSSITDVVIEGNVIETTLYGINLETVSNGNGTIADVMIANNSFVNNSFSPILANSRTNPASGVNRVENLTVEGNTFAVNAGIYSASFFLIDFRNVGGANSFKRNDFTLSGTLPSGTDAVRALAIRGSRTGTFDIHQNNLQGGGVKHNNSPTVLVSGIAILTEDAGTGRLPAGAVIDIRENFINGFEDGIVFRDGVAPTGYGNIPAGVDVNIINNDLSGNTVHGVRSGAGGEMIDASGNWWGIASAAGVASRTTANVDYTPWLHTGNDADLDPTNGFQGDFSQLHVDDSSPQTGNIGRINEGMALLSDIGTLHVHAGTYLEDVDITTKAVTLAPGASPGQVTLNGNLRLDQNDVLDIEIDGPDPVSGFDNLIVNGTVVLGNATLNLTVNLASLAGSFKIIDSNVPVVGTFANRADDTFFFAGTSPASLNYNGGDGNDVVLSSVAARLRTQATAAHKSLITVTIELRDFTGVLVKAPAGGILFGLMSDSPRSAFYNRLGNVKITRVTIPGGARRAGFMFVDGRVGVTTITATEISPTLGGLIATLIIRIRAS